MTTTVTGDRGLWALARLDALRFARHPLFLVCAALFVIDAASVVDDRNPFALGLPVGPAFYLGVIGLVVAHQLARSSPSFRETSSAAPVADSTRTLAMCAACLVPAALAATYPFVVVLGTSLYPPPAGSPWFGTVAALDVWAILVGGSAVAAFGGSVLGVLVARWVRFPGAGVLAAVLLAVVVLALAFLSGTPGLHTLQLVGPWALWLVGLENEPGLVILAAGSPVWHLLYLLCLCGLAVLAALLAATPRDRRVVTAFAALAAVALVCAVPAMTTGNPAPVEFRVQ